MPPTTYKYYELKEETICKSCEEKNIFFLLDYTTWLAISLAFFINLRIPVSKGHALVCSKCGKAEFIKSRNRNELKNNTLSSKPIRYGGTKMAMSMDMREDIKTHIQDIKDS